MRRLPSRARTVVLATAAALALSACGGDDTGGDAAGAPADGDALAVTGTDTLQWDVESLSAEAGAIDVQLTCEEGINHNFAIPETGETVAECAPGETVDGTVELDAGTYIYICTVPGHEATMTGELTVT